MEAIRSNRKKEGKTSLWLLHPFNPPAKDGPENNARALAKLHNKSHLLFVFSEMLSVSLHSLIVRKLGLLAHRLQPAKAILRFGSASNLDYLVVFSL
jgi:hypothetical protein